MPNFKALHDRIARLNSMKDTLPEMVPKAVVDLIFDKYTEALSVTLVMWEASLKATSLTDVETEAEAEARDSADEPQGRMQ